MKLKLMKMKLSRKEIPSTNDEKVIQALTRNLLACPASCAENAKSLINQSYLGIDLGISANTVLKAIKRLCDGKKSKKGIITEG